MYLKPLRPTADLFSANWCRPKIKQLSDEREIIVGRIDFSINNNS